MNTKNLYIVSLLFLTCGVFGSSANLPAIPSSKAWKNTQAGRAVKKFMPVAGDNSIVFGSKTVKMESDGRLSCITEDGSVLFTCGHYFWVIENGSPV